MEVEVQNTTEQLGAQGSGGEPAASTTVETPKVSPIEALKEKASTMSDAAPASKDPAAAVADPQTPTVPAAPVYAPNFKYKAWGQERELDKRIHGIIKDKETEDWIKSVFSKADGIESMQQQREHIRNQYNTLNAAAEKVLGAVKNRDYSAALRELGVDTQDIGQVLSGLNLKKEDIIQYAYNLANLTPEQEQAYAKQRQLEINGMQQQDALEGLNQKLYQADVQLKTFELRSVLSTPEMAPVVETFDKHHGKGAFWDQVCQRGDYYHLKGVDKSTTELVDEVLRLARAYQPQQAAIQPAQTATPAPQVQKDKIPVIPNVMSGGGSPAKKRISTLSGLKAHAQQLED